jgi:nickel transport protein
MATIVLLAVTSLAEAHNIRLFASVEDHAITGHASYGSGDRIANATVRIGTWNGESLAEVVTAEDGTFRYEPVMRGDLVLTLELADGHVATRTIHADELPLDLPASSPMAHAEQAATGPVAYHDPIAHDHVADHHESNQFPTPAGWEAVVRDVVRDEISRQIRPVREQIDRAETAVRWRDVVGGIGYILGLAGLAAVVLARRSS